MKQSLVIPTRSLHCIRDAKPGPRFLPLHRHTHTDTHTDRHTQTHTKHTYLYVDGSISIVFLETRKSISIQPFRDTHRCMSFSPMRSEYCFAHNDSLQRAHRLSLLRSRAPTKVLVSRLSVVSVAPFLLLRLCWLSRVVWGRAAFPFALLCGASH